MLAGVSRLVIDLNRPPGCAASIPGLSEATVIPGKLDLTEAERQSRITAWFTPFHDRLAALLDQRRADGRPTGLVAVHSFTPVYLGEPRPWRAGVLYRRSQRFGAALVEALGGETGWIAHNQPYQIEAESDYTVPVQGEARGIDAVLIELRQDLVGSEAGATDWAARLARALRQSRPSAGRATGK